MSTLSYPYNFTPNTTIASAQVNANFAAISTLFNTTGFGDANITPGGISHVSLASASVQKDTLNTNCFDQASIVGGAGTSASINTAGVQLAMLASAVANALCPTGSILAYGSSTAPSGWLLCDGTSYSTTTYANLYAVIGSSYGTASAGNFNVPDLRGLFIRGASLGAGTTNDPDSAARTAFMTGGATGNNIGSYQVDQFASHNHSVNLGSSATNGGLAGNYSVFSIAENTGNTGGNQTNPRNIYCAYIIKY